jgi:hypothetical protein
MECIFYLKGGEVMRLANFANIGKSVLLKAIGLQTNTKSVEIVTKSVIDAESSGCLSCLNYSLKIKSTKDGKLYAQAMEVCANCNSCKYKEVEEERIVYINEKNKHGYLPRLKSLAIKQFMLYHFLEPDKYGVVTNLNCNEIASVLNCSAKSVKNNNLLLENYGYIQCDSYNHGNFTVLLNEYATYHLPASKGGRGYITLTPELLQAFIACPTLNSLRIELRKLIELDTQNLRGNYTAITRDISELRNTLPSYCKPCVVKKALSIGTQVFDTVINNSMVTFTIKACYLIKEKRKEIADSYKSKLSDFLKQVKDILFDLKFIGDSIQIPDNIKSFLYSPDTNNTDTELPELYISDSDLTAIAALGYSFSYDQILDALSKIYNTKFKNHEKIKNLPGLVRATLNATA